jgi:hypothetical protein
MQLRICLGDGNPLIQLGPVHEDGYTRSLIEGHESLSTLLGLHHWTNRYNLSFLYLPVKVVKDESGIDVMDSCVAAMQSGLADITSDWIKFPVIADNVKQTVPALEFSPSFLTTNKPTSTFVAPDLMDFWASLPMEWYISSSLLFMVLFYLALLVTSPHATKREIRKASLKQLGHMTWLMVSYIICYFGTPIPIETKRQTTAKVLYAVIVFMSLVYKNHVGMITNTELVVRDLPDKIQTLRQVKDHGMIMAFIAKEDVRSFREKKNAEYKELLDITMSKGASEYLFEHKNSDEADRAERILQLYQGFLKQKHAIITSYPENTFQFMCGLAPKMD